MLDLASANLVDRAGVPHGQGGATQELAGVPADNASEHVQPLPSSGSQGIGLLGNALSGSFDYPPAANTDPVPTENNCLTLGERTQSITNLGQFSAAVAALRQLVWKLLIRICCRLFYRIYELPMESLCLMDGYYQQSEQWSPYDVSTVRMDVVTFFTVCHAGLLQKFAMSKCQIGWLP